MKSKSQILLLLILLALPVVLTAQVNKSYQVAAWPEFRNCAVTYTFDDWSSGQYSKAVPVFDSFGYKATFFVVSGWVGNWTPLQNTAKAGHEIANHTATHPNFNSLSTEQQETEIKTSSNLIDSKISDQTCVTMAYPYCVKGNDALHRKYFIAARGCQGFIEPSTPGDIMNVSSIICGELGAVKTTAQFKAKADQAAVSKGWLVYLIHGIDNDGGYSPLPSDTLKASLQYLKDNDSKFWVTTFANAAKYVRERNCVSVEESAVSADSLLVSVNDTLSNNVVFNYPLTIRRILPAGWQNVKIIQNNTPVNHSLVEVSAVQYIQFNVIPDSGPIIIFNDKTTGVNQLSNPIQNRLKTWITNNEICFSVPESCGAEASVAIYDLKGSRVFKTSQFKSSGVTGSVSRDVLKKQGIYVIVLSDNKKSWTERIALTH